MAFGPFNAGSGAAYEVEALAAQIMSGELSTPLDTTDEVTIQTTDGEDILAVQDTSTVGMREYVDQVVSAAFAAVLDRLDKAILAV